MSISMFLWVKNFENINAVEPLRDLEGEGYKVAPQP